MAYAMFILTAMPLAMGLKINAGENTMEKATIRELEKYTFEDFVKEHNRKYKPGSAEWAEREKIFSSNMGIVIAQRKNRKEDEWKAGPNKFLDWSKAEFIKIQGHKGPRESETLAKKGDNKDILDFDKALAETVDYTLNEDLKFANCGYIRDQGQCGSCWAVAATNCLEAHMELVKENRELLEKGGWYKHGSKQELALTDGNGFGAALSAQNIVSCTPNLEECGGSGGCEGATESLAFEYVKKHGISWALKWKYTSYFGDSGKCDEQRTAQNKVFIGDWRMLERNNQEHLMRALAQLGPVTVSVAASEWSNYQEGVFDACLNDQPDKSKADYVGNHAVLAYGYGQSKEGKYYWLIKNSWGPDWGMKGFIHLARTKPGEEVPCGMDEKPQDGSACKGDDTPVKVCGHCGVLYESTVPLHVTIKSSQ